MLGENFKILYNKAKNMQCLKCQHTFQSVDRCIKEHAQNQKLIVCSQDKILRRRLRYLRRGLMYFGPDQRITM